MERQDSIEVSVQGTWKVINPIPNVNPWLSSGSSVNLTNKDNQTSGSLFDNLLAVSSVTEYVDAENEIGNPVWRPRFTSTAIERDADSPVIELETLSQLDGESRKTPPSPRQPLEKQGTRFSFDPENPQLGKTYFLTPTVRRAYESSNSILKTIFLYQKEFKIHIGRKDFETKSLLTNSLEELKDIIDSCEFLNHPHINPEC